MCPLKEMHRHIITHTYAQKKKRKEIVYRNKEGSKYYNR